ncbi:hypothetical protein ACEWY4_008497 [Coilia grayii]|uniref:Ig-like domain-containing protein n=1 Tax=Coilia grayii TaxID=363190 RepID=A0ABD1KB83_9TELE
MQPSTTLGSLLLILCVIGTADAYTTYRTHTCHSSSMDFSDMVFADTYYFNRVKYLMFNSTVGKYVGCNEFWQRAAERLNNNKPHLEYVQDTVNRFCGTVATLYNMYFTNITSEPAVRIILARPPSGGHPAMLVCSAYDFYPRMIRVTWYRDGNKVTSDVSSTEELADGDWFYQIHSHLEFFPTPGEKLSCVVEHQSLKEPREFVWDASMPVAERNKVAVGAAVLVLGLAVCVAGVLYHRKTTHGWILVPPRMDPGAAKMRITGWHVELHMGTTFLFLIFLIHFRSHSDFIVGKCTLLSKG